MIDPEERLATAVLALGNLVIAIGLLSYYYDFW